MLFNKVTFQVIACFNSGKEKKNFLAFFHYCKHSAQLNGNDHPLLHLSILSSNT